MNIERFPIGTIVLVTDKRCRHYTYQGLVVGHNPGDPEFCLRVWFGKECDHYLEHPDRMKIREATVSTAINPPTLEQQADDARTWEYSPLHVEPQPEWSMQTLTNRHFKGRCWGMMIPKSPFVKDGRACQVDGCTGKVEQRIIFNVWGNIAYADVCASCAFKYHGKLLDDFPYRKSVLSAIAA